MKFEPRSHIGAEMARNAGGLRYFLVFNRQREPPKIWHGTSTFSEILRSTGTGKTCPGSVRNAAVPGSNPRSPNPKALCKGVGGGERGAPRSDWRDTFSPACGAVA